MPEQSTVGTQQVSASNEMREVGVSAETLLMAVMAIKLVIRHLFLLGK